SLFFFFTHTSTPDIYTLSYTTLFRSQITGIVGNASGKVFLCASNPGKVFSLGPEYEAEGTFESHSFDAQLFSQWGRIEWWSPPRSEEHTSELQSRGHLVCRLLLEKKK